MISPTRPLLRTASISADSANSALSGWSLVTDLTAEDIALFRALYAKILSAKGGVKGLLQTYFGDIMDCCSDVCKLDFDGVGLDFIEGKKTLELVKSNVFPKDKTLFAGIVNGKNIWCRNYADALSLIKEIGWLSSFIEYSTNTISGCCSFTRSWVIIIPVRLLVPDTAMLTASTCFPAARKYSSRKSGKHLP